MKYKRKHNIRIGGKMSTQGADKAGLILATGLALAAVISSFSLLIWVLK